MSLLALETCQGGLTMSVVRGRPEATSTQPTDAIDPKQTSGQISGTLRSVSTISVAAAWRSPRQSLTVSSTIRTDFGQVTLITPCTRPPSRSGTAMPANPSAIARHKVRRRMPESSQRRRPALGALHMNSCSR